MQLFSEQLPFSHLKPFWWKIVEESCKGSFLHHYPEHEICLSCSLSVWEENLNFLLKIVI